MAEELSDADLMEAVEIPLDDDDNPPDSSAEQTVEDAPDDDVIEETEASGEDEADQTTEAEEPEASIESVDDLAEAMETDLAGVLDLKATAVVNGESVEVTIGEAIRGYQRQADYDANTKALKAERTEFEAERTTHRQYQDQTLAQYGQWLGAMEQAFLGEMNEAELQRLQTSADPADVQRAIVMVQQHQARSQQLNGIKQQFAQAWQQNQQQMAEQQQAQMAQMLEAGRETLLKEWPEYAQTATRTRLADWLTGAGFTEQEVATAADPRLILMAEKARKWDEAQQTAGETLKRVRKLPKLTGKPGKQGASPAQRKQLTNARAAKKAKQSGTEQDAANWLLGTDLI